MKESAGTEGFGETRVNGAAESSGEPHGAGV